MVKNNIPKAFKVNPKYSLQTLTPIHEKALGRKSLNKELQNILNEESDLIKRGEIEFRRNDNIMQTKNNYDKEVFNGDSGEILSIGRNQIDVTYNGKIVNYERTDFDQLELSYAITMHKSQGSEYPLIIIPISSDYSGILDRSLLYTAITRGKERVIIIGSERRLKEAIKNDFSRRRKTYLREILIEKLK
jgi:exodeoxyribonuclease V alpha subunit